MSTFSPSVYYAHRACGSGILRQGTAAGTACFCYVLSGVSAGRLEGLGMESSEISLPHMPGVAGHLRMVPSCGPGFLITWWHPRTGPKERGPGGSCMILDTASEATKHHICHVLHCSEQSQSPTQIQVEGTQISARGMPVTL